MATSSALPLEDELGDVLEKAMHCAGLNPEGLADRSGVPLSKILDAIDYRPDLAPDEVGRLASALGLNEVGLGALAAGRYPRPELGPLPFAVWPLRMRHGIGVANAYVVAESGSDRGVLCDTGAGIAALESVWPPAIRSLDAVFLTHVEAEHAGGLCAVVERFGAPAAFIPRGAVAPCGKPMGEGDVRSFGRIEIAAFTTPGHAPAHNCYHVRMPSSDLGRSLLLSGDLIFAGSAGGGYFSVCQLQLHLRRMLEGLPPATVIAPGHGPMTTVANELKFNPFLA
jgi:glyoxylase-like metal-dependent hydrolase (beta-lactamase superfamily II)